MVALASPTPSNKDGLQMAKEVSDEGDFGASRQFAAVAACCLPSASQDSMFFACWSGGWICPNGNEGFALQEPLRFVEAEKAGRHLAYAGERFNGDAV